MLKAYRLLTFAVLTAGLMLMPARAAQTGASSPDTQIQADVQKALGGKKFRDVKVSAQNGVVALSGTVHLYIDKHDAGNKAQRSKDVKSVQNEIVVAGTTVEDSVLEKKLARSVDSDRTDTSNVMFEAVITTVKDGVVTMNGYVSRPQDKDYLFGEVANYPGVKDVVDHIEVTSQSGGDKRIRTDAVREIFSAHQLSRYYSDPGKPIRIIVDNGTILLVGVVATQSDKDMASTQANLVRGITKVVNNLNVAAAAPEK